MEDFHYAIPAIQAGTYVLLQWLEESQSSAAVPTSYVVSEVLGGNKDEMCQWWEIRKFVEAIADVTFSEKKNLKLIY